MSLNERKSPGDRIKLRAQDFNYILDSAKKAQEGLRQGSPLDTQPSYPCTVARVLHDDQLNIPFGRFDAVGLNDALILPSETMSEFKRQPGFRGERPKAGHHEQRWGLALEPFRQGKIGSVLIDGVCPALVGPETNPPTVQGQYVEIQDNSTQLRFVGAGGSARVLWADPVTNDGYQWCLVQLGHTASFVAKLTKKTFQTGHFTAYDWTELTDITAPTPLTYVEYDKRKGGFDDGFPAYDLNNIDHPVPCVVRLYRGRGDYMVIDEQPRAEIVRRTALPTGGSPYAPGKLERWDQLGQSWADTLDVLIIDANG